MGMRSMLGSNPDKMTLRPELVLSQHSGSIFQGFVVTLEVSGISGRWIS